MSIKCQRFGLIVLVFLGQQCGPRSLMCVLLFYFFIRHEFLNLLYELEALCIMYCEGEALYIHILGQLIST